MSLINEALKKAQKMRQAGAPETTASPPPAPATSAARQPVAPAARSTANEVRPPARIAKRRKPVSANKVVGAVMLIVVGFSLLAAGAVYFFIPRSLPPELNLRPDAQIPQTVASGPVITSAPVIAASPTAPSPQPIITEADNTPPEVRINLAPPPSASILPSQPDPVGSAPAGRPIGSSLPSNPVRNPIATPPTSPPSPPPPDSTILALVEQMRVSGVRPSATAPRILMNDKIFQLGDIVDRTYNLRLIKIEERRLTFEDPAGIRYVKNF